MRLALAFAMPIREYTSKDPAKGCRHCRSGYEVLEKADAAPQEACPECGEPVRRCFSSPRVGRSQSGEDDRARQAGFSKLKRVGKGEYEKEY